MTLQLKLIDIQTSMTSKQPSYIYVEGGQSGSLRLTMSSLPQTIRCSARDHLTLIICGSKSDIQPQQGDVIAKRDYWAQAMLDQDREKWDALSGNKDGNIYKMNYYNEEHNSIGQLVFEVRYNRGLLYQGQISSLNALRQKPVSLYTGRCPTYNFYNCLDSREGPAEFHFIQRVYKDE